VLLSLLAGNFREKFWFVFRNPVVILALFLFGLLVLSISYTIAPWPDVINALQKYGKLLYIILLLPLFKDDTWKRAGINAFPMIVTLIASFLKMFGWLHLGNGGLGTIFTNHINTGFLMAFAIFIVAHRTFDSSKWRHWIYASLLLIMIVQLFFMNEGRTGYWVFAVLTVLFLWQKLAWKGLIIAIIFLPVLVGMLFIFSGNFRDRIEMINKDLGNYHHQHLRDNSIGLRLVFTKNSLLLIREHPLVGTGIGSFRTAYQKHFPPDPGFERMSNPQNEYLMIAVQLGLIGLMVLFWLFYYQWHYSFVLSNEFQKLAQGMVVAFMAGCLCDTFIYLAIPGYFFVYFTSLFYAQNLKSKAVK
jgi:O-antigen ligase